MTPSTRTAQTSAPRKPSARGGFIGLGKLLGIGAPIVVLAGATFFFKGGLQKIDLPDVVTQKVVRKDFVLTVSEKGELEAMNSVEIRCEVKAKNTAGTSILRIVEEGAHVERGDFLVEFDSSALEAEKTQQQIVVNTAKALMIQSKNSYDTANITKTEYLEGTFLQEQQAIEGEVFVAEENLRRAQEYLQYSKQLAAKGYVTPLQLEADQFAVEKFQKELETTRTKLDVLQRFTKQKMIIQLESDIVTAEAKWKADESSYLLEQSKLDEILDQIAKCVVTAPTAGQVKYAHRFGGRGGEEDFIIEEGAVLRELQPVIRLPDPTRMQVKININEAVVDLVEPRMATAVRIVGLQDTDLPGTVIKINQYSEPTSWRTGDIKEYATYVRIDKNDPRLRSGMTAEVTIECERIPDVLQVPVQAVYAHGDKYYCFLNAATGPVAQEVHIGPTNDKFAVIESGLDEDMSVIMNPRNLADLVDLPKLSAKDLQQVVQLSPDPPSELGFAPAGEPANPAAAGSSDPVLGGKTSTASGAGG